MSFNTSIIHKLAILLIFLTISIVGDAHSKKVYDENIDPNEQIDNALSQAKTENKNVICQVGGNWCRWCLMFADYIEKDAEIAREIEDNFIYIHVNYPTNGDNQTLAKRLKNPGRFGYPVLVILSPDGDVIHIQDSGLLEQGEGYDHEKVLRFFKLWTPEACGSF